MNKQNISLLIGTDTNNRKIVLNLEQRYNNLLLYCESVNTSLC